MNKTRPKRSSKEWWIALFSRKAKQKEEIVELNPVEENPFEPPTELQLQNFNAGRLESERMTMQEFTEYCRKIHLELNSNKNSTTEPASEEKKVIQLPIESFHSVTSETEQEKKVEKPPPKRVPWSTILWCLVAAFVALIILRVTQLHLWGEFFYSFIPWGWAYSLGLASLFYFLHLRSEEKRRKRNKNRMERITDDNKRVAEEQAIKTEEKNRSKLTWLLFGVGFFVFVAVIYGLVFVAIKSYEHYDVSLPIIAIGGLFFVVFFKPVTSVKKVFHYIGICLLGGACALIYTTKPVVKEIGFKTVDVPIHLDSVEVLAYKDSIKQALEKQDTAFQRMLGEVTQKNTQTTDFLNGRIITVRDSMVHNRDSILTDQHSADTTQAGRYKDIGDSLLVEVTQQKIDYNDLQAKYENAVQANQKMDPTLRWILLGIIGLATIVYIVNSLRWKSLLTASVTGFVFLTGFIILAIAEANHTDLFAKPSPQAVSEVEIKRRADSIYKKELAEKEKEIHDLKNQQEENTVQPAPTNDSALIAERNKVDSLQKLLLAKAKEVPAKRSNQKIDTTKKVVVQKNPPYDGYAGRDTTVRLVKKETPRYRNYPASEVPLRVKRPVIKSTACNCPKKE